MPLDLNPLLNAKMQIVKVQNRATRSVKKKPLLCEHNEKLSVVLEYYKTRDFVCANLGISDWELKCSLQGTHKKQYVEDKINSAYEIIKLRKNLK